MSQFRMSVQALSAVLVLKPAVLLPKVTTGHISWKASNVAEDMILRRMPFPCLVYHLTLAVPGWGKML